MPVVDILSEPKAQVRSLATSHAHRVHVEQQTGRTPFRPNFRIENMDFAEAQIEALTTVRMFVQQIAQVRRGPVSGCDGQEHSAVLFGTHMPRLGGENCCSPGTLFLPEAQSMTPIH